MEGTPILVKTIPLENQPARPCVQLPEKKTETRYPLIFKKDQ